MTLRRVVELAGMAEHCDFTEQLHLAFEDGALRPDMVIHMPEKRSLVVDVKTPLDAYLEAIEAVTDDARAIALKRHAQQLETRIRQLGSKNYWAQFEESPEFAVLFLPGDQFLSAALAERPEMLDTALKVGVILATPSTLIALLKTVAYGWRQAAVAENAATIRELGQELHRRLTTFVKHLEKLGKQLNGAVDAYNSAVGSLERQVMPQARRFPELGVTADAPLPALEPIAQIARTPTAVAADEPSQLAADIGTPNTTQ
jgi:DNA recombination protein RmuC